jgi:hypothetical protein
MKKFLSLLAVVFTVGLSTVALDAEAAKRLGGGKSVGTQRQAAPPAKAPDATPSATPGAAGAAGATAASSRSKWMGPIAGIAAGLGIAALASHLGFGEELASFMTMALIAMAVMVVIGLIMRPDRLRRHRLHRPPGCRGAAGACPGRCRLPLGAGRPRSAEQAGCGAPGHRRAR